MDNFDFILTACDSLNKNKGKNIVVIDTSKNDNPIKYFVFVTADDFAHCAVLADDVVRVLESQKLTLSQREGFGRAEWIALDFDNFFVHIFTKELREKYNIEKMLSDGKNTKKYETILKEIKVKEKKVLNLKKEQEKKEKKLSKEKEKKTIKEEKTKKEKALKTAKDKDKKEKQNKTHKQNKA